MKQPQVDRIKANISAGTLTSRRFSCPLVSALPLDTVLVFCLWAFVGDFPHRDVTGVTGSVLAKAELHNNVISGLACATANPGSLKPTKTTRAGSRWEIPYLANSGGD